jgi:hypothetical protein
MSVVQQTEAARKAGLLSDASDDAGSDGEATSPAGNTRHRKKKDDEKKKSKKAKEKEKEKAKEKKKKRVL